MDPLFQHRDKAPIKETTLEEVRLGLLRDARNPQTSLRAAAHYRRLAEMLKQQSFDQAAS